MIEAKSETLRERLLRGPLTPAEALRVGRGVLESLREAHARGVLHGAVGPGTIVVQDGSATLVDFEGGVRELDARADLRSLGVTLFEALSGAPPRMNPRLQAPRAVEQWVGRLLHPGARAVSAAESLDDLAAAHALLDRGDLIAPLPGRVALGVPRFVGRAAELKTLLALLQHADEGRVAALSAEPGGGKTRLLDELARRAPGFRVLRARRTLAEAVAEECRRDPAFGPQLVERLGDERATVAAVFPSLPLGAPDAPGPEERAQGRADHAAAALLSALGTPARPALILLDDCAGPPPARAPYAVVIVSGEPAGSCDALVTLTPLSPGEQRAAAQSMAGPLPEAALAEVARRSAGNPLLLEEALFAMVESGALVAGEEGFTLDAEALAALPSSSRAGDLLARRLELLPAQALRLLSAGALLNERFPVPLAAALAALDPAQAADALEECRRRQLLTEAGAVHPRVRAALAERLDPEERRRLHLLAAQLSDDEATRAGQLDAAAEHAAALPHALAAAAAARARFDFESALHFLRIAGRGAAAAPEEVRAQLFEQLAAVLTVRGHFAEAEAELARALALARDPLTRARLQGRIGELAFRRGDHAAAAAALEGALERLGHRAPRFALPAVALEILRRALPRRRGEAEADRLAARLHSLLTWPWYFQRGPLFTLWTHLRELSLAERLGDSPALAQAYGNHALALAQLPWTARTLAFAARSVEVARRVGDRFTEARVRHVQALVLFWSCRYREGLAAGRQAMGELLRLGDPAEANAARFTVAACLYRLGNLREAAELARVQHRIALEVGGAVAIAGAVELWAKASGGRVPAQAIAEARRRCGDGDAVLSALLHSADGLRLLRDGEVDAAVAALSRSDGLLARFRNGLVADVPAHLAAALRAQLESLPQLAVAERRAGLRRARRAARRALRLARKFEKALPHALREAGLVEALAGRPRAGARFLRESLSVARRQEAAAEALRTGLALAQLEGDGAAASAARSALRALGDDQDGPGDRAAQVLRVGRALTTALSPAAVHGQAREAAAELLRAASCTVEGGPGAGLAAQALTARSPLLAADGCEACAPIVVRGVAVACLNASSRPGLAFGEEELRLLGFVAALAGAALENAEGLGRAQRAEREVRQLNERAARATEEDRRRLALALHDGAGQTLSAAALQLGTLRRGLSGDAAARADRIRELITATLDDLRGLARDLRPAALDRLGLVAALEELAASATSPELAVELRANDAPAPPEVALSLYRIAQSALGNVLRHSGARRAAISLEVLDGRLRLCVEDDGRGFDPDLLPPDAGIGLAGMRERAAWLGGVFTVASAPGRGTRVQVEVALPV